MPCEPHKKNVGVRPILATLILLVGTAQAGSHKMFLLRADSTTDWVTRTKVEKTVLGLARNVDRGVSRSDMSLADLSLSVGCTKGLEGCKRELLGSLMLDELVVITIVPAGDDKVKVTVRRATKADVREATATADKADPERALVASIGPLFDAHKVIGEPAQAPPSRPSKGTMTTGTVEVDNERPPAPKVISAEPKPEPAAPEPTRTEVAPAPKPVPAPAPVATAEPAPAPAVTAAPDNVVADDRHSSRRSLYIGGMAAGGAVAIVGILCWTKASSIETDARAAPNRSSADIAALRDLESSGDHYALAGNVMFFGGLAVAAVSGVLYWRSREGTRVAPMTVDHGGGVALSFEVP